MSFHFPFGFKALNAPTGLRCVRRPMVNSVIIIGKPSRMMNPRYTSTKTAPPFWPVMYGKRQIFPKPMADPAAAKMNPNLDVHVPRSEDLSSTYPSHFESLRLN